MRRRPDGRAGGLPRPTRLTTPVNSATLVVHRGATGVPLPTMFRFDTLRVTFHWPRAVVVGVLLFLGADVVQREWIRPPVKPFHLRPPNSQLVYRSTLAVAGQSRLSINSHGVRGPEFPARAGAYRILCIGDSVTECFYLDDPQTWPALLMEWLNREPDMPRVWVGNVGHSGYNCFHHLHFLKESPLLKEVDCVVLMAGTADVVYAICGYPETIKREGRKKSKSWLSDTLETVRERFTPRQQPVTTRPASNELPDLSESLERYRQRLREIAGICRDHGVRLVLVSSPTVCRQDDPAQSGKASWNWKRPDGRYLTDARVREAVDRFNEATAAAAGELAVEFVDATSLNGQPRFFADESHLSVEGTRQVAQLVARSFLARRGPRSWQPGTTAGPAPVR